ncbi:hypothetical protein CLIT_8c01520 [Peptoclostridium litorale DSM 5388]|uniref:Uncharacterized protein n=1 Tax=Peptoclostridium litorale DSM 5388 TaxID=1121324 RepID=A0A069RGR4_PEPLI|nr:hypothetical protein CLIT_8c01520 [Peptoclostridium litorale DSM 5388]
MSTGTIRTAMERASAEIYLKDIYIKGEIYDFPITRI